MAHREIAFRLFNLWKNQQLVIIEGIRGIHPQYVFGYRSTLEKILFFIDSYGKHQEEASEEFLFKLQNEIIDSLKTVENEPYERGSNKALSDVTILFGEVPPFCISSNSPYVNIGART